jgi:head-tail adaptor
MLTNIYRDRIGIQIKSITQGATGQTVTWSPVETRWGRVIPLDAKTKLAYQQYNSVVTHRIEFRKDVSINLALNRFTFGSKVYLPTNPPQSFENGYFILVRET